MKVPGAPSTISLGSERVVSRCLGPLGETGMSKEGHQVSPRAPAGVPPSIYILLVNSDPWGHSRLMTD